jgi:hypothetical protein
VLLFLINGVLLQVKKRGKRCWSSLSLPIVLIIGYLVEEAEEEELSLLFLKALCRDTNAAVARPAARAALESAFAALESVVAEQTVGLRLGNGYKFKDCRCAWIFVWCGILLLQIAMILDQFSKLF